MSQRRKMSIDEKIKIAQACLSNKIGISEAAQRTGADRETVKSWINVYENEGIEGFTHIRNRTYEPKLKVAAVTDYLREAGLEDRRGKRKKDQTPRTELEAAQIEIERLKHQLYMAEMERKLLKKLDEIERRDASHK